MCKARRGGPGAVLQLTSKVKRCTCIFDFAIAAQKLFARFNKGTHSHSTHTPAASPGGAGGGREGGLVHERASALVVVLLLRTEQRYLCACHSEVLK